MSMVDKILNKGKINEKITQTWESQWRGSQLCHVYFLECSICVANIFKSLHYLLQIGVLSFFNVSLLWIINIFIILMLCSTWFWTILFFYLTIYVKRALISLLYLLLSMLVVLIVLVYFRSPIIPNDQNHS